MQRFLGVVKMQVKKKYYVLRDLDNEILGIIKAKDRDEARDIAINQVLIPMIDAEYDVLLDDFDNTYELIEAELFSAT